MTKQQGKNQLFRILVIGLLAFFIVATVGGTLYIDSKTYKPDFDVSALMAQNEAIKVENKTIIVEAQGIDAGQVKGNIVFYQGGLVKTEAYIPLAQKFAERGYKVFIPKMPLNLAITNTGAISKIQDLYPSELPWYIGGHSLGGTSAIMHLAKNEGIVQGLFLLGSYGTEKDDLSNQDLKVISIIASQDKVMGLESYERGKAQLPTTTIYETIEGGNHSGFGNYGKQKGDGTSTISPNDQQNLLVELVLSAFESN